MALSKYDTPEQRAAHDAMVSCYESECREDGITAVEMIHERRLSDGSCRCGHYKPRAASAARCDKRPATCDTRPDTDSGCDYHT